MFACMQTRKYRWAGWWATERYLRQRQAAGAAEPAQRAQHRQPGPPVPPCPAHLACPLNPSVPPSTIGLIVARSGCPSSSYAAGARKAERERREL